MVTSGKITINSCYDTDFLKIILNFIILQSESLLEYNDLCLHSNLK